MRTLFALLIGLAAGPAGAWEFSPTPVCTLTHAAEGASLRITHDPRLAEPYALTVNRGAGWADAPAFGIRFDGARGMTIATDRHRLSPDRRSLSVTDRGFGNVLDGLEFNGTATAMTGADAVAFDLDGAAQAVRAFRNCTEAPLS
ncbi:MAG: hypothetical protein ACXIUV_08255 [Alkalilacustris sp.]